MFFPVLRGRPLFWISWCVSVLLVGAFMGVAALSPARAEGPAAPPAAPAAPAPPELVDFPSARVQAKATGKKVEVTAEKTDTSSTWVNPDGTVTTEQFSAPVRFQDEAGTWQSVDTTLVKQSDGTIEPKSVDGGVELAPAVAGAEGDPAEVASLEAPDDAPWSVALGWEGKLGAPALKGSTATYPNAWPGIDLTVRASRDGFEQSFVVKDRASAEAFASTQTGPTVLWELPILAQGVNAREVDGERIEFVDRNGAVVSTFEAPMAWDAKVDPASREHVNHAAMGVAITSQGDGVVTLGLTVDRGWLLASDRHFPVTIDPVYAAASATATFDAYVQSGITADRSSEQELKVGTYDGSTVARSFVGIPNAQFQNQQIISATFNVYETWSWSCTPSVLEVWSTGLASSSVRWTSQPNWISKAGSANVAKGGSSACGAGWVNIDITAMAQGWSSNPDPRMTIGLRAGSETSTNGWKRFASMESTTPPSVTFTYNRKPAAPEMPTISGSMQFGDSLYVGDAAPTVTAIISDPDANDVRSVIQVFTGTDATTKVAECVTGWVASGQPASCTLSALPDERTLYVRASAQDGNGLWAGAASPWRSIKTAQATPVAPSIACPALTSGKWAAAVPGSDVVCTVTAPSKQGNNQAVRIDYRVDGQALGTSVAVTPGQSFQVTLPKAEGGHQIRARVFTASGKSDVGVFTTGWGGPSVIYPQSLAASNGKFAVKVLAPPRMAAETTVSAQMKWRPAGTQSAWTNAGSATNVTTAPGTAIDFNTTFDAAAALAAASSTSRGAQRLEFQVCFAYSGVEELCTGQTRPTTLVRVPHAFGSGYPTAEVEAGQVALYTGEFQASATDATVPGYGSDITVSRSHLSYTNTGSGGVKEWPSDPVTGVFGPGFTANLEGDSAVGLAGLQVVDRRKTDATLSLVAEDGDPLVFMNPDGALGTPSPATLLPATDDTATSGITAAIVAGPSGQLLEVKEDDGTITRFIPTAAAPAPDLVWRPLEIAEPGQVGKTTFGHDANTGAVTRIVAPLPDGLEGTACATAGQLAPGCRALDLTYISVTGPDGKAAQRVSQISAVMFNPATGAVESKPITSYTYDSLSRLSVVTDVRSGLKTTYTWEGETTRISTITPSGLAPYELHYAANPDPSVPTQMLKNVQRGPQTAGANNVQLASIVYNVPVSGPGLPDLSENAVGAWALEAKTSTEFIGQKPVTGYAVFGSDHPVSALLGSELTADDMQYASLQYVNSEAYTINSAVYGAGTWNITASRYDALGNITRTLDAKAIATITSRAATTTPLQAGEVDAMSTQSVYNEDIKDAAGKVLTPKGTLITDTYGPARTVLLADGTTKTRARPHVHTTFDEKAPNGGINPATGAPYRLPTTVATDLVDTSLVSGQTPPAVIEKLSVTTSGYDAIDGKPATDPTSGWVLGAATTSTDAVGRVTSQRFDARGKVVERRQPASNGSDAGTTRTIFYTAAANSEDAACGASAQAKAWAGLPCRSFPAGQPNQGPTMPDTRVTGYDYWLAPTSTVETSGAATRTSQIRYDAAGRPIWSKISTAGLAGSKALDATFTQYNATTGLVDAVGVSNAEGTGIAGAKQMTTYDLWGKPIKEINQLGDITTTTYDDKARVTSVADAKGTTAFEYNGTDANGKAERRGSVTKQTVSRAGTTPLVYTAAYDANGAMTTEKLPGGIVATHVVDEAGEEVGLSYAGQVAAADGTKSTGEWFAWSQVNDGAGRVRTDSATYTVAGTPAPRAASADSFDHRYSYDAAGALVKVEDRTGAPVAGRTVSPFTTREYAFTKNGARASLRESVRADGTATGRAVAGVSQDLVYDTADRPVGGYVYDLFGRQTTLPAKDAPSPAGGDIALGYFDNDLPASVSQGGTSTVFTLDVAKRRLVQSATTAGQTTTTTRHYTDGSDNPSWIEVTSPAGTVSTTRFVSSISGSLGAAITSDGVTRLELSNIHGDIVTTVEIPATAQSDVPATGITGWAAYTEYGTPIDPAQAKNVGTAAGYGWIGAKGRSTTDATAHLTLMGARFYNRTTGSFSGPDPIPGANSTSFQYPTDPINVCDASGLKPQACNGIRTFVISRSKSKTSTGSWQPQALTAALVNLLWSKLGFWLADFQIQSAYKQSRTRTWTEEQCAYGRRVTVHFWATEDRYKATYTTGSGNQPWLEKRHTSVSAWIVRGTSHW
ncbi:DNRLRE domain-containing protein [Brachybacterium sp. JHP9]|uniref:DNRLRE domain-containing protein n=1 Tax=Brachybacterium equifaecis TaxID=2910770 RepID=A0ABT0R3M1_9MICO|nr:DNRLRE domain-containing protein [Brachybacterium equifaecis]MCL6424344.1 DNRLRE domain-containing protein [Brachybacterium equifaecis]